MTYDELTAEQKAILAAWERNVRGWLNSKLSRGIVEARALQAAHDTTDGVGDILALLDAGQVVPNSSGIAGAHDLDTAEWALLISAGLNDYLTKYDTLAVRQVLAKAAGPTAGLE